jgi:hypothetical protein
MEYLGKRILTIVGTVRYGKVWAVLGRKKERKFVAAIATALEMGWERLIKVGKG